MTRLSVNINKIALLRNSRGRNYPDVGAFAARCLDFGAGGITLHPRPDQRHARYGDVRELKALCVARGAELNVEGYPTPEFLSVVLEARPDQCTLVPDAPGQLTSDHGWSIREHEGFLRDVLARLKRAGIRSSLFMDYDSGEFDDARAAGADRIELYTEPYAVAHAAGDFAAVLEGFRAATEKARRIGLEVNGGHDLNLGNLRAFLAAAPVKEVSIGHALVVESLEFGLEPVIGRYLAEIEQARVATAI
jgi:pyridoxine 5-phosphate synthase